MCVCYFVENVLGGGSLCYTALCYAILRSLGISFVGRVGSDGVICIFCFGMVGFLLGGLGTRGTDGCIHVVPYIMLMARCLLMERCRF